ncbi:hypothetical protein TW81_09340 [Vibrio galatheae]|uniref:Uncharacterized protein n=1 Tax=Vibrio galatheae TaxID=579748 RepID=A0A0F4NK08_9VIBR|nr:DUF2057 family protein [Vibrio galatheae]KJY83203.1 hypothetical protein TW81_09340 [Vibrio galatheae]
MKWILTLFALFSFSVGAAVIIPEKGLSILYVNEQKAESKIGRQQLPQGDVQLVVKMDKKLGRGNSAKVFTSNPFVLSFVVTGEEITIDTPVARSAQEATNAFKSQRPEWKLVQDGEPLEYHQEMLPSDGKLFPYLAMDKLVAEYNQSKGIFFEGGKLISKPVEAQAIAAATTSTAVTSTASKVEKTSPAKPVASSNVEQLKAWYLKSSKEERKEFRRWMIDQE